ncbi:RPP1 [Candida oxycetoniae]|uniref:RPP1 n=1 Tax=Candida oxycetoniae TaxID=497107 RepID=A0AAI9T1R9_9ASCO|nr:RPP1 [Candida oxycetoniae]KAI3407047.2 RPP1 [Candida oxycetoniae]
MLNGIGQGQGQGQGYDVQPTEQQMVNLKNTIVTNYLLGVTHQVINFTVQEVAKIASGKADTMNPIQKKSILSSLQSTCPNLRLFTRITLVISDTSKLQGLSKLQNSFDVVAIQPLNEKALQMTILNIECDLISLDLATKLPFFLKFKTIGSGIQKGIKFEINYSQIVSGTGGFVNDSITVNLVKKNWFNNTLQLIRSSRSRGLVVSSGAQNPLQLRNSNDILILLKTLGLDNSRAKACISMNPENVLVSGRLRMKSHKQVISIGNEEFADNSKEDVDKKNSAKGYKRKYNETSTGRLLKKKKYN